MKFKILFLLILCLCCSSCKNMQQSETISNVSESIDTSITFTDALNRTITINTPKRVAATLGSFAQIWMLAGGTVCATADDAWEDLHLELSDDTVNLGNTKELSLELLLASKPDFILASTNTRQNLEWRDILEASHIPVAYFDVSDFDDYLHLLSICTQITGRHDLYEMHGIEVQAQIENTLEKNKLRLAKQEAPSVLSLVASASSLRAKNSQNNVLGVMLANLGCINIADSDTTLLETISMEHILEADPDFIFIVQRGDDTQGMYEYIQQMLMDHPVWAQLSAVKNKRIYYMEKTLFNLKPNHQWGLAYEQLEDILSSQLPIT